MFITEELTPLYIKVLVIGGLVVGFISLLPPLLNTGQLSGGEIEGDVFIQGINIVNLDGLSVITAVGGSLKIINCDNLVNFSSLDNLTSIGGDLIIENNDNITNLSGLDTLNSIGGGIIIENNNHIVFMKL